MCTTTSVALSPDAVNEQSNVEDVNTAVGKTTNEPNLPGVGGKENISSTADSDNTVVQNADIEELSVNEKRAAKRKKQKESKFILDCNVQKLSGDSWTLEGALKNCGLEQKPAKDSTEVMEDKKKAKKQQNKQAVETGLEKKDVIENDSGFGDWNRHETLGLAFVKSGLITPSSELSEDSENGKNPSECSEVISPSELDTDDILRSLVTDKTAGNGFENVCIGIGSLANTLDQRSSVTDSSGVETSSDADSDHPMYVIDSADQKSDVPNDQHTDLHQPEDSACEQEAEFITVSKKRKPKSLPVDRNANNRPSFSSTDLVSPDSGGSSPQQEQNASISQLPNSACAEGQTVRKEYVKSPENSLSLDSTACTMVDSEPSFARQSGTSFDVSHQPCVNFSVPPENSSTEKHITDHDSMYYLDNFSSRASLSDIGLDDLAFSYLLKETSEDDWTVVKNGRRSKNYVQSTVDPSAVGENKQSLPVTVSQCSTSVIREHVASEYGRGKANTNSGRGRWSTQNSRCKSFDGSNSKTFDHYWRDNGMKSRPQEAGQKNFFPSGVARSNSSTDPKYRDRNCDILSRCNSNGEFSLSESNPVPARCQEIPRFSQKSTVPTSDVPMINNCTIVGNSSEGAKTALNTMSAEPADDRASNTEGLSSEKTRLSRELDKSTGSSYSKLPVAEKIFIRHGGTINLIETQIYLYRGKTSRLLFLSFSLFWRRINSFVWWRIK